MDEILYAGCLIQLTCPPPLVVPALAAPVPLDGSAQTMSYLAAPFCLEGDELPRCLREPLEYTAGAFVIPGLGRLSLVLGDAHWSSTATFERRRFLRCGPPFQVRFEVVAPAMQPSAAGPVPDPVSVRVLAGRYVPRAPGAIRGIA